MRPQLRILNGTFDALSLTDTVDAVFEMIRSGNRGWLSTVNVSTLMAMRVDPMLQSYVDRAALVVADGQPLVWCAPLFGRRLPERVTGIDLIGPLCARAATADARVYLLGGTSSVLQRALSELRGRHPALRIDGADGYFPAEEEELRAAAIAASGADILLVGMGSPRQERFIATHWDRLGVRVAIGVGGSFDVLAGTRYRAHPSLRRAGLEWLVRLVQEPRRLARRYLATNSKFSVLIARSVVTRKRLN